jgi:hypothetical protein
MSSLVKLFGGGEEVKQPTSKDTEEARRRARLTERNRKGTQSTILTLGGGSDLGSPATSRATLLGG